MKQLLQRILPHALSKKPRNNEVVDSENELIYIHIGKCGGSSLWEAINQSTVVKSTFSRVHKVHMGKPPVLGRAKYLIVIRNPIRRAISAFNWRYKLVVEDEVQRHRFEGEWEILSKYKTLNSLAENLYDNGTLNEDVATEFQSIHHLKENIEFYLDELLETLHKEQVFGVLATETLGDDVMRQLAVSSMKRTYENGKYVDKDKKVLSERANANLKAYLQGDYRCLETLLELNPLTVCEASRLLE